MKNFKKNQRIESIEVKDRKIHLTFKNSVKLLNIYSNTCALQYVDFTEENMTVVLNGMFCECCEQELMLDVNDMTYIIKFIPASTFIESTSIEEMDSVESMLEIWNMRHVVSVKKKKVKGQLVRVIWCDEINIVSHDKKIHTSKIDRPFDVTESSEQGGTVKVNDNLYNFINREDRFMVKRTTR